MNINDKASVLGALSLGLLPTFPIRKVRTGTPLTEFSSTGHPPLPKPKAPKRSGRRKNKNKNKK